MCNVNERTLLSSNLNLSLLSPTQTKVEEHSESMFHITCCGASMSKDQDMVSIGDFAGNLKIYDSQSGNLIN